MNANTQPSAFSHHEPSVEDIERPFRPSAVFALLLALVSFAAIFTPYLLILPATAIALALFALRPSRHRQEQPSGRPFAVLGIALALLFAGWSISYFRARNQLLTEPAVQFAEQWLQIMARGEKEVAFELTKNKERRQMADMSLTDFYDESNSSAFQELDSFATGQGVAAVLAAGDKPKWRFVETREISNSYVNDLVFLVFEDETGLVDPIEVIMARPLSYARKAEDKDEPPQWYVFGMRYAPSNEQAPPSAL